MGEQPAIAIEALLVQAQAQPRAGPGKASEKLFRLLGEGLGGLPITADFRCVDTQQPDPSAVSQRQGVAVENHRTDDALVAAIRRTAWPAAKGSDRKQH
jgi:hypothetical protein